MEGGLFLFQGADFLDRDRKKERKKESVVQIFGFALTLLCDAHTFTITMNAILLLSQRGAAASTCWLLKQSRFVTEITLHIINNLTEDTAETTLYFCISS